MIYTVTWNPAIDYKIDVEHFKLGSLNRTSMQQYVIGGKGINVSIVLEHIGIDSIATGFIGGFTGDYIINEIEQNHSFQTAFITVQDATRVNVKINDIDTRNETEINASGPVIHKSELAQFMSIIDRLNSSDLVIISGSPAKGEAQQYDALCAYCYHRHIPFIIDTSDPQIIDLLQYQPLLVKPNLDELSRMFDTNITSDTELIHYGKELIRLGASTVIISLGKDGSMMFTKNHVYQALPIIGNVVNTVGAGDSMVAGFVSEYGKSNDIECYRKAVACATATAYSTGLASKEQIEYYLKEVKIIEITN